MCVCVCVCAFYVSVFPACYMNLLNLFQDEDKITLMKALITGYVKHFLIMALFHVCHIIH